MMKTKQFMKKAALVGAFVFASLMPLHAQKLDTAKALPKRDSSITQKQDTAKPQKKKTVLLQPKLIARAYGNAQSPALGAGLELSKDIGKISIGATGSAVFDGKNPLVEESSIWAGAPVGKAYVVGYAYSDLFYFVEATKPGFGIAVKYPVGKVSLKAGFERGYDFSCQYDKVILRNGMSVGITTLFWGDQVGYGAPIGRLQKYGVSLSVAGIELMYREITGTGKKELQVRYTLKL